MALLSAVGAKPFLKTSFPFFLGEFPWFSFVIYVHSIGVVSRGIPGRSWGMESNGGSGGMLLCDRGCKTLLTEKLVYFLIPSFGHGWDYLHAIDLICVMQSALKSSRVLLRLDG